MQTSAPNTNLVPASLKAEVLSEALPFPKLFLTFSDFTARRS